MTPSLNTFRECYSSPGPISSAGSLTISLESPSFISLSLAPHDDEKKVTKSSSSIAENQVNRTPTRTTHVPDVNRSVIGDHKSIVKRPVNFPIFISHFWRNKRFRVCSTHIPRTKSEK